MNDQIDIKTGAKMTPEKVGAEDNNHKIKTNEKAQLDQVKAGWVLTRTLIVSMLVLKTFFLYFGLKYSEYPGEGYGYGLAITGCLSVFNIGYFLYKVKDYNFD